MMGMLAMISLLAFLVVGLGTLLASFWLASLIVTAVLGLVAGLLMWSASRHLNKDALLPVDTMDTLRDDVSWVKDEARMMKNPRAPDGP
jgi:hypothetical protein